MLSKHITIFLKHNTIFEKHNTLNIGVMWFISPDVTIPIRGKALPLKVRKDAE